MRLRHLRGYRGLTQAELARRAGVSKSDISGYEAGKREPRATALRKISDALEVSAGWLIGQNGYATRVPNRLEFLSWVGDWICTRKQRIGLQRRREKV